jgi:hypothetical protein
VADDEDAALAGHGVTRRSLGGSGLGEQDGPGRHHGGRGGDGERQKAEKSAQWCHGLQHKGHAGTRPLPRSARIPYAAE